MSACVWRVNATWVKVSEEAREGDGFPRSLELKMIVSHPMGVLGAELWLSASALSWPSLQLPMTFHFVGEDGFQWESGTGPPWSSVGWAIW